jgi:aryl-alcohol dehydrogenase-like predicted oxidoreductase
MRITGPGIWGLPKTEGEAIALLRRAVEKGVTLIDTADSYGVSWHTHRYPKIHTMIEGNSRYVRKGERIPMTPLTSNLL